MTDTPSGDPLLEELVASVERLVSGAGAPLRRVRLRNAAGAIDVQWQERSSASGPAEAAAAAEAESDLTLDYIRAPLIGTFYVAPSPGAAPFVTEGDTVEPGQQVGIIESMKLMNAVEADRAGRVLTVLVADATSVEYDERLIALVPLSPDV